MNAYEVYRGSDGALTRALYAELERRGPAGGFGIGRIRSYSSPCSCCASQRSTSIWCPGHTSADVPRPRLLDDLADGALLLVDVEPASLDLIGFHHHSHSRLMLPVNGAFLHSAL